MIITVLLCTFEQVCIRFFAPKFLGRWNISATDANYLFKRRPELMHKQWLDYADSCKLRHTIFDFGHKFTCVGQVNLPNHSIRLLHRIDHASIINSSKLDFQHVFCTDIYNTASAKSRKLQYRGYSSSLRLSVDQKQR
jgi:hypothetical protein